MSRLKLFIPLIIFAILAAFFWRGLSLDPTAMPSALIDKPIPAFQLPRLEQPESFVTEADLTGQVQLLNVWGTWCVACRVEHPFLLQLAQRGVAIVGINYKDDVGEARKWLQKLANPYRYNIVDEDGRLGIDLGVFGAPETYLVDARGVIRYKHVGVLDEAVWSQSVEPIFRSLVQASQQPPASEISR